MNHYPRRSCALRLDGLTVAPQPVRPVLWRAAADAFRRPWYCFTIGFFLACMLAGYIAHISQ